MKDNDRLALFILLGFGFLAIFGSVLSACITLVVNNNCGG